ncbi:hypothetical protein [Aeromonas caviae]|uniref:hypothetical protein n=1 Tax=Aeromonas caviae TaxID=648 RepID=UPI001FBAAAFC|nr:hypothetical protein [Aeromonas caviae]MDH1994898.1 hypothetical protein [Aeromonas caviae]MEA9429452.1 hypothetical protein [Aeromonas caviae]WEE20320.1 hypothetical protein PY772_14555 [Aeromonas caviae]BDS30017.1 hypothetical protein KAM479c_17410 [Aeromonas caviae]GKR04416.1 hypothetical protein KAM462_41360 [Aeromonas caviae]
MPWRRNRSSSCRHFPHIAGIWLANLLITFCLALMPLAIQRFFGEPPNWRAFTLFMLVYLLILCWSVIFNDKMAPRVLLACLSYMMVGAVIVWLIWRHVYPDYLPAVLVFTVVNILLYGFNLVRMGALLGGEVRVLMDQHAVNVLPFLSILNAKGDSLRRRWEGNFAGASAPLVLNVLLDHL